MPVDKVILRLDLERSAEPIDYPERVDDRKREAANVRTKERLCLGLNLKPSAPKGNLRPAGIADLESPSRETAIRVRLRLMYIDTEEDADNGCPVCTRQPDLSAFEGQVR